MTMMAKRWTSALLTLLSLQKVLADSELGFCCLCNRCSYPGSRADIFLNDSGLSCAKLDAILFNPADDTTTGSVACQQNQNTYRDICCNPNSTFQSVPQKATQPPVLNMPQGNQPWCDICLNKSYPTKPYTITTVAYIPGNPTCMDLYWMGRTGNIPGAICYPLQLYMQGPCGCNAVPVPAPVPAPVPVPIPVPAPVPRPAPAPAPTGGVPGKKDVPQTTKNDLKLGGGRDRGTTNNRSLLLKGATTDESLESIITEIAADMKSL